MYSYLHWQCDMEDSVWSLGRKKYVLHVDTHNAITEEVAPLDSVCVCSV